MSESYSQFSLLHFQMDCYLAWNERAGLFVTLRNRSMEGAAILPTDQYTFAIVSRVDYNGSLGVAVVRCFSKYRTPQ